jgi:hypothetical protein
MFIIALVMLNNVEHLAYVHYSIEQLSPLASHWHSVAVVLIVELSIMFFVRKGHDAFALVFTLLLLAIQLIYYPLSDYWQQAQYGKFMAAVIFSSMFTLSIYYFSRIAAHRQQFDAELHQWRAKYFEAEKQRSNAASDCRNKTHELHELATKLNQATAKLQLTENELQKLKAERQQFEKIQQQIEISCTCKKCGSTFATEASRRSHEGRCRGAVNENKTAA